MYEKDFYRGANLGKAIGKGIEKAIKQSKLTDEEREKLERKRKHIREENIQRVLYGKDFKKHNGENRPDWKYTW